MAEKELIKKEKAALVAGKVKAEVEMEAKAKVGMEKVLVLSFLL